MVGPKKQDFWPKINILKENDCIFVNTMTDSSSDNFVTFEIKKYELSLSPKKIYNRSDNNRYYMTSSQSEATLTYPTIIHVSTSSTDVLMLFVSQAKQYFCTLLSTESNK